MARNVVICCDGTGNQFSTNRTNVLRLWRSLVRSPQQLTYYDPGVGTISDPKAITWLRKKLARNLDAAIGLSVRDNALKAYRFLIQNWQEGDQLFLFGFSRGAYTVRVLAAMLDWFGLLRAEHDNIAPYLWMIYSNEEGEIAEFGKRMEIAGGMKKTLSRPVTVRFLGAWDTVSSFGWLWSPRTLPGTARADGVGVIRHAVSIDERRVCFRQNLFLPEPNSKQDVCQMLFAGVHSDVGGGYPAQESGLAKIAFQWMNGEAVPHGLLVHESAYQVELHGRSGNEGPDPRGIQHNESRKWLWRLVEALPRIRLSPTGLRLLTLALVVALVAMLVFVPEYLLWLLIAVAGLTVIRLVLRWNGRARDFRVLGDQSPALHLHPSAEERMKLRPDYRPTNIKSALRTPFGGPLPAT